MNLKNPIMKKAETIKRLIFFLNVLLLLLNTYSLRFQHYDSVIIEIFAQTTIWIIVVTPLVYFIRTEKLIPVIIVLFIDLIFVLIGLLGFYYLWNINNMALITVLIIWFALSVVNVFLLLILLKKIKVS